MTDIYAALTGKACKKTDHKSNRKNCAGNPYCLVNMQMGAQGIWGSKVDAFIDRAVGANLLDRVRNVPSSPIRLMNLGATCYLNVLMHCLYFNIHIRNAVYKTVVNEHKNKEGSQVLRNLQEVFAFMDCSRDNTFNLSKFTGTLRYSNILYYYLY